LFADFIVRFSLISALNAIALRWPNKLQEMENKMFICHKSVEQFAG